MKRTILLMMIAFVCGVGVTRALHRPKPIAIIVPSADVKRMYDNALENLGKRVAEAQQKAGRATYLFVGLPDTNSQTLHGYPVIYEGCIGMPVVNGVEVQDPFYRGYNGFLETNPAIK